MRLGKTLLSALLGTSSLVIAPAAWAQSALPQGGQVVAGSAAISANGANGMTVTQTSARAIVNWDSYAVGQGNAVNYVQPDAQAAILNRVTGATTSQIAGTITGNGQVYLVNPNGIAITSTGSVRVDGGFVASSLDLADTDFLSGRLAFGSAGQSGTVSNAGTITIGSGGFAALLGGRVANTGVISVPLGKIGLGAGEAATLDLTGDGFLQIVLPSAADGSDPLVTAAGSLSGARIALKAGSVANALRSAVYVPGQLAATAAHQDGGVIVLDGGLGNTVVSGMLDASSAGAAGGQIHIGGTEITLSGASLNASGLTGGAITVGGGAHGAAVSGLGLADITRVDSATTLRATGTGSSVVLWSNKGTAFAGTIEAGTGFVETSSAGILQARGLVHAGQWLLDPSDVTIQAGGGSDVNEGVVTGTWTPTSGAATSTVFADNINSVLGAGTSVTIATTNTGAAGAGTGNITLGNGASIATNTAAGLTLNAVGGIIFNAGSSIDMGSGALVLNANGGAISSASAGAGNLSALFGGSITFNAGSGTGTLSGTVSGSGNVTKTGAGTLVLAGTNTYTGTTTVSQGILRAGSTSAFGSNSAVKLADGATLDLAGFNTTIRSLDSLGVAGTDKVTSSAAGAVTLTVSSNNDSSFSGVIENGAGTMALAISGPGTFALSGPSTYSGGTTISGSNYTIIHDAAALGTGTVTVNANSGLGLWILSGSRTVANNIVINSAGVAGNNTNDGRAAVWGDGGGGSGPTTLSGTITLNNAASSIGGYVLNDAVTITGQVTGPGGLALTSTIHPALGGPLGDDGDVVILANAANNYAGATQVNSRGLLQLGVANALPGTSAVTVASGAKLDLNGFSTAIGSLAGAGMVTSGVAGAVTLTTGGANTSTTFSGTLQDGAGTLSLTKNGSGTQTLSGAGITYTGATTIAAGTLKLLDTTAFASASTVNTGATLALARSLNGFANRAKLTGTISGAGTVLVDSATNGINGGWVQFTNGAGLSAGFTGSVNVNAGVLTLDGQNGLWAATPALTVGAGGLLALRGQSIGVSSLSGAGDIFNSSTFSGAAGDTLTITNPLASSFGGNIHGNVASGGTDGALEQGVINVAKAGAGTLTLGGTNTFGGTASVNAGTLALSGSWNRGAGAAITAVSGGATLSGTGVITAATLTTSGTGTVSLTGNNAVGTLSASGTIGAITFNNNQSLALGSIDAGANAIAITTTPASGASLTLNSGTVLSSTASGTAISLAADANFVNNAGSGALSAPSGRWLVYSAAPGGDTFGGLDSGNTAVWNTAPGAGVTATGNRYTFAFQPTLTFTSTNVAKTYGAVGNVASAFSVGGFQSGVSGAFAADVAANVYSGAPALTSAGTAATATVAGGPYAITIGAGSLTSLSGYAFAFQSNGLLTVGQAPLTITGNTTPVNYTGLAQTNGFTTSTLFNTDTVTAVTGLGTGTNVGTYADTLSGATGTGLANYTISYVNGGLTINPAALTLTYTANSANSLYGAALAAVSGSVSGTGFVNGEGLGVLGGSAAWTTTATAGGHAGSYAITGSGLTSTNYAITAQQAAGNATAYTINQASLSITANGASRTYDGTAFSGGNGIAISGFVNGDSAASLTGTLAYGGTSQGAVNAGTYAITASGLTNSDYAITWNPGVLTIGRAGLTITGNTGTATYSGVTQTNGFTTSTLFGSDAVTGVLGRASGLNVGSYTDTLSGATGTGLDNYNIAYVNGGLTINPAALTLTYTASNASSTYGAALAAVSGSVSGTGFVNGEGVGVLGGSASWTTTATAGGHAGSYGITGSGLTSTNYTITRQQAAGNATAYTINPAALTITANGAARTYNGTAFSGGNGIAISGFVNGDSAASLTGTLTYGGSAQGAVNAGTYAIAASGLANPDYAITFVNGALTIGRASLTITGNNGTASYTGVTQTNGFTTSTLFGSDAVSAVNGRASGRNVGSYLDSLSGATGTGLANYDITYVNGGLTINPVALTLTYTANNASSTYGAALAALSGSVSGTGFVNGEGVGVLGGSAAWTTTAAAGGHAGSYGITGSGLTSSNYTITSRQAAGNATAYTINPASLTITANGASRTYNGTAFTGGNGIAISGLVNGDSAASLTGTLTYGGSAQGSVNAGNYAITASGLANSDYTISYVNGALTINPAALTLTYTANNASSTYGGPLAALSGSVTGTGFVNGEGLGVLGGSATWTTGARAGSHAGTYAITGSGLTSTNYAITARQAGGNASAYTINPASLSITANDAARAYDGTAFSGGNGITISGLVNGDSAASLTGTLTYGGTAQGAIQIGTYTLTASGLTNPDYAITWNPGTLKVVPASFSSWPSLFATQPLLQVPPATVQFNLNLASQVQGPGPACNASTNGHLVATRDNRQNGTDSVELRCQ